MNFKKFISLLFVVLLGICSFGFADSHRGRNIYGIYTETYNGAGIDDSSAGEDFMHFWPGPTGTSCGSTTETQAEGKESIKMLSGTWLTCRFGPHSDTNIVTHDFSNYDRIYFSANFPNQTTVSKAEIQLVYNLGTTISSDVKCTINLGNSSVINRVDGSGTGINYDGNWHSYYIELSSFGTSLTSNLNKLTCPLILVSNAGASPYYIDNVYFKIKDSASTNPAFSVVAKNIYTNSPINGTDVQLSFSVDSFQTGWAVAEQYFEIDIDGEMSGGSFWTIRLFTNNDKAGLYNGDDVLPTAWRATPIALPYNYIDDQAKDNKRTFIIGEHWQKDAEGKEEIAGLYDKGQYDFLEEQGRHDDAEGTMFWYPWFYMKANGDSSADSIILKNSRTQVGCHVTRNTDKGGVLTQYYDNLYEKNPKIYIGCDTKNASALNYTMGLIINLSYDE